MNKLIGKNYLFPILLIGMVLFSLTSCGDDEPARTRIFGTITIDNIDIWETWQDSGEVQLTIFPEFSLDPLSGWGEVPDGAFGPGVLGGEFAVGAPYNSQNPLILTYEAGKTEYDYEIELEPGIYSALALGFRNDNVTDPSLKTATLGVHHGDETTVSHGVTIKVQAGPMVLTVYDEVSPSDITIAAEEELEINFRADFDIVNSWYQ